MKHFLGKLGDGIVGQDDCVEGLRESCGGRKESEIVVVENESL